MDRKSDFLVILSLLAIDFFSVALCLWGYNLSVFRYVIYLFLIIVFLSVASYILITRISHIKGSTFAKEIGILIILDFIICMAVIGPGLISGLIFGFDQLGAMVITFTVFGAHLLELIVYVVSLLLAHHMNKTR